MQPRPIRAKRNQESQRNVRVIPHRSEPPAVAGGYPLNRDYFVITINRPLPQAVLTVEINRPLPQAVLTVEINRPLPQAVLTVEINRPLPQAVLTVEINRPLPQAVLTAATEKSPLFPFPLPNQARIFHSFPQPAFSC